MLLALVLAATPADCPEEVSVSWKAGDSVATLATWASKQLCRPHAVDPSVASRKVTVGVAGRAPVEHARALFLAALATAKVVPRFDAGRLTLKDEAEAATAQGECDDAHAEALLDAVTATSEDERTVRRDALESDWAACAARQARVVPAFKGGVAQGFKLFGIRPRSLYTALGLQNGDVVLSVNAFPLTSPDKALLAYEAVRRAEVLTLALDRQGAPRTLTIRVTQAPPPNHAHPKRQAP